MDKSLDGSNNNNIQAVESEGIDQPIKVFKCTDCERSFTLIKNLNKHIREKHPALWLSLKEKETAAKEAG